MANRSQGGNGSKKGPEIKPNLSPIAPIPSPETAEELEEQYDESPSLLDEPEIAPECLKDLEEVIKDGMGNYPRAANMHETAPDDFRLLYAQEWELLPDNKDRRWAAVAAVEKEIKKRE